MIRHSKKILSATGRPGTRLAHALLVVARKPMTSEYLGRFQCKNQIQLFTERAAAMGMDGDLLNSRLMTVYWYQTL